MGVVHSGPRNPNWRGGRVVDPRGYVLIRVGKDHPLADVRGYAYEHRLTAYADGRLAADDPRDVHHENEDKGDNTSSNLEPLTRAEHMSRHYRKRSDLQPLGAPNPTVSCACGCGASFSMFDRSRRPRRFVSGHNMGGARG